LFDADDIINVLASLQTEADSLPSNKTQPPVLTNADSFPLQTLRFGETAILRLNRLLLATSQDRWLHSVSVQMGVLAVMVKSMRNLIEIATFSDQEHDEHYSKDLIQLLATYRNMVHGEDVNFPQESLQRLNVVCMEAVEQGLLAD
jgi:hypothetical protein